MKNELVERELEYLKQGSNNPLHVVCNFPHLVDKYRRAGGRDPRGGMGTLRESC